MYDSTSLEVDRDGQHGNDILVDMLFFTLICVIFRAVTGYGILNITNPVIAVMTHTVSFTIDSSSMEK